MDENEINRLQASERELIGLVEQYGSWIEEMVRTYCGWSDTDVDQADGEPAMLEAIEAMLARANHLSDEDIYNLLT